LNTAARIFTVAAVTGALALSVTGGVASARHTGKVGTPANVSGKWSYKLTSSSGKTKWNVYFLQSGTSLTGSAKSASCSASTTGTVTGKKVSEAWTCPSGQTFTLTGKVKSKNKIAGKFVSSQSDHGKFVATKHALDDDGGNDDGGSGGGGDDGGSSGGGSGGDS